MRCAANFKLGKRRWTVANENYDNEALDPFLQSFFDAEAATQLPGGAEQRVLSGVLQSVSVAPPAAAAATMTTGKAIAFAVASGLAGVLAGIAIDRTLLTETHSHPATKPLQKIVAVEAVDAGVDLQPTDATALPLHDAALAIPQSPLKRQRPTLRNIPETTVPPAHAEPENDLPEQSPHAREAHLIDRARSALRRGLFNDALLALMQHERTFSGGQLAEERDVLIIETYVAKGSTRIAKRRIQRYRKSHPKGFHRSRVDRSESQLGKR